MTITAKIIKDSMTESGIRITTMQLMYPRFIHAEFMTHRVFSRNASSSRAIPVAKMLEQVRTNPAMPIHWGKNEPGMQARAEVQHVGAAQDLWRLAAKKAAEVAEEMNALGLHKQVANRILEPFQHIQVVVTATEWNNFYGLRNHPDAQPEIQALAKEMFAAHMASTPEMLADGDWHLPYILEDEKGAYPVNDLLKMSAARCARVSYLLHDGTVPNVEKDIALHDMLVSAQPPHMSPVEHQAMATPNLMFYGNFYGWQQYRKLLEPE